MFTPIARRHPIVEDTSSPLERPVTKALPRAMAFKINARWEMDLSPGTLTVPCSEMGG
jgi:hypothetical protein